VHLRELANLRSAVASIGEALALSKGSRPVGLILLEVKRGVDFASLCFARSAPSEMVREITRNASGQARRPCVWAQLGRCTSRLAALPQRNLET